MSPLEIVRQLARMSTPSDEYAANVATGRTSEETSLEDYTDDLSSDRMEDDARALWRLIEEARKSTCPMCAPVGIQPQRHLR